MKKSQTVTISKFWASGFLCFALLSEAKAEVPYQFDFSNETTPEARRLFFETRQGRNYNLWSSKDLESWSLVPGYPRVAQGQTMTHTFAQGDREFFKIDEVDDQPPEVERQFPRSNAFGVSRFGNISITLKDPAGIDPASIRMTVGRPAELTPGADGLTYADNVLTYDLGAFPLGDWGSDIYVTLRASDLRGNTLTHAFTFTLEVEPRAAGQVFVFGSPAAQRAGQKITPSPTSVLALRGRGPVPMGDAPTWKIAEVLPDRVVVSYTGDTPPGFAPGALITNLTPASLAEAFYRRTLEVTAEPARKEVIIKTQDVPITDFIQGCSCSVSPESQLYDLDGTGAIRAASSHSASSTVTGGFAFPRIGIDVARDAKINLRGDEVFTASWAECSFWATPSVDVALEISDFSLQRAFFHGRADVEAAILPQVSLRLSGSRPSSENLALHAPRSRLLLLTVLPTPVPIPVWVDFSYSTTLKLSAQGTVETSFYAGFRGNMAFDASAEYKKGEGVTWTTHPDQAKTQTLLGGKLTGTATFKAAVVPQLDVRLMSAAGFYVNIDPRFECGISGEGGVEVRLSGEGERLTPNAKIKVSGGCFADVNAGLSIAGVEQGSLPALQPVRIRSVGYEKTFFPDDLTITLPVKDEAETIPPGSTLDLHVEAQAAPNVPVFYQWYKDDLPLPGANSADLSTPNAQKEHSGVYTVKVRAGDKTRVSPRFTIRVAKTPPEGFVRIPAGSFNMGWYEFRDSLPYHSVYVDEFYIGKYEITLGLWREVQTWAVANGYPRLTDGNGREDDHPMFGVGWYNLVKWCNARSEKENLKPCYTLNGQVFRTGTSEASNNVVCDWTANGYRLPTEAEWEKAARGGTETRFPWGELISHRNANYNSRWVYNGERRFPFDANPVPGCHPDYDTSGVAFSSPVGSFAPNGYGLYDVAGNMSEQCWDWYDENYYAASPSANPRGPSSSPQGARAERGGDFLNIFCMPGGRSYQWPGGSGYRSARLARSRIGNE